MNREPIEIRFVLDAPHTDYQSDINTLILRIDKLVKFYISYLSIGFATICFKIETTRSIAFTLTCS